MTSHKEIEKKTILVIDDDENIRSGLVELLKDNGYGVVSAQNGREGLFKLTHTPVDLVITDIFMPTMDGLEFIRTIRKQDHNTKILAISGGGQMKLLESLDWAQAFGASQILKKPFTFDVLLEKISTII